MARQTLTWLPDVGSTLAQQSQVNVIKFGDGYENRIAKGLNSLPMKWSLSFTRSRTDTSVAALLAFFRTHAGVLAFDWTSPINEAGVYVCRDWKTANSSGYIIISADFEQVFEA